MIACLCLIMFILIHIFDDSENIVFSPIPKHCYFVCLLFCFLSSSHFLKNRVSLLKVASGSSLELFFSAKQLFIVLYFNSVRNVTDAFQASHFLKDSLSVSTLFGLYQSRNINDKRILWCPETHTAYIVNTLIHLFGNTF